jgi:hypothetical protein
MRAVGAGFLWISARHAIELWQICLIAFAEAGCAPDGSLNVVLRVGLRSILELSGVNRAATDELLKINISHIANYRTGNMLLAAAIAGTSGIDVTNGKLGDGVNIVTNDLAMSRAIDVLGPALLITGENGEGRFAFHHAPSQTRSL